MIFFRDVMNAQPFRFRVKTDMRFGIGVSARLHEIISEYDFMHIGVIIDKAISESESVRKILDGLQIKKIKYDRFINTAVEPDYDYLEEVRRRFAGSELECLVGIGGGSTLDLTKGLATLITNKGPAISYRGFPNLKNPPVPVIAIPTTAGTGSEVTYNAVFTDKKEKRKLGINSELNFPLFAVLDPILTLTCPKSVTISSGMDALTHSVESFVNKNANPISRLFSKQAFALLFNNLFKVVDEPEDIGIRSDLLLGSYLAGIALINSGSGPAGALSYPLGVNFEVPHGIAGAVFLPFIIRINIARGYRDYTELYDLIEGADSNRSVEEKNKAFKQKFEDFYNKLEIPRTLFVFGVRDKDKEFLINQYDILRNAIDQNPIAISKNDVEKIIEEMLEITRCQVGS